MSTSSLSRLLPDFYGGTEEFRAIFYAEEKALEDAADHLETVFDDTTVLQCCEEVLTRWEHALGLDSVGSLEQRHMVVNAKMRGQGPLSKEKILNIVSSFTGGEVTAYVSFSGSTILVQVLPPENGELFDFSEIRKALEGRIPAHLQLTVNRYYSTWEDIASAAQNWQGIGTNFSDWGKVKDYIER